MTQLYQLTQGDFLEKNLKKIVQFIENKSDIEILAIGIGHDVSRYYEKAIKITDVQELGDVMIGELSGLFENKKNLIKVFLDLYFSKEILTLHHLLF